MKTKNKKYLPLYHEWIKTGKIGQTNYGQYNGLCELFKNDDAWQLIEATDFETDSLRDHNIESVWWGSGFHLHVYTVNPEKVKSEFTPLRQTILLFMAALNNEL